MRDLLAEIGANGLEVSLGVPRYFISRSLILLSNSAIVLLGVSDMLPKDDDEFQTDSEKASDQSELGSVTER